MSSIFDELKAIAAERSSEKRLELLHKIADLFLDARSSHNEAEYYLFNDIMEKIVDQISREAKVQVATNLATLSGFPAGVVRTLAADDDIDIARPVLRGSPVLEDSDLIGIAMTRGQDHMHAIATRDRLSPTVTDVLIDRGDDRVVHRVSANHGAQFSERGLEQLVDKARADINLGEILVNRPDLTQSTVDDLLPLVSQTLAIKLAQRGYDTGEVVPPEMMRLARKRFEDALRDRQAAIRGVSALAELIASGDLKIDEAMSELIDGERLFDVATLAASVAKLDRNDVFSLIMRGQSQMLMLLFRALDVTWSNYERVMVLRAGKLNMPAPNFAELAHEYYELDKSLAQRTIRFLQVRHKLGKPADQPAPQLATA
jgi:uncharacterized protein (DUF2336 family)